MSPTSIGLQRKGWVTKDPKLGGCAQGHELPDSHIRQLITDLILCKVRTGLRAEGTVAWDYTGAA
jgi:hypothetical protein